MAQAAIVGHIRQRRLLERLLCSGRLPSAMLLTGPSGIGKSLVARELAQSLFCERVPVQPPRGLKPAPRQIPYGGCRQCKACRLFAAGNTPDYHLVECLDREKWNIEGIRDLLYSLNLKSFAGGRRVVIFNNAEHMSEPSGNALLKALEEPRPDTHFILVSASHSKLLPTVVSRCQSWFFDSLSADEIKQIVTQLENLGGETGEAPLPAGAALDDLARLADGSMENLGHLAAHHERWAQLSRDLEAIHAGDAAAAQALAAQLAKDREQLRTWLQLLRIIAREKMSLERRRRSAALWAECLTNLIAAERLIFDRNLSAGYVLNATFLALTGDYSSDSWTTLAGGSALIEKMTV